MRTLLFLIALICSACSTLSAQLNYGVNAGMNLSTLGVSNNQPSVGASAGVFAEYYLPSSFGFGFGIYASQKGTSYIIGKRDDMNVPSGMKIRLNYIDLPLDVRYKIRLDDHTSFFVKAGGYFSYGISAFLRILLSRTV